MGYYSKVNLGVSGESLVNAMEVGLQSASAFFDPAPSFGITTFSSRRAYVPPKVQKKNTEYRLVASF